MRIFALALIVIISSFLAEMVSAQMSSTNYEIRWDTVGVGGDDTSSSATYQVRDTLGNQAIGDSTSSTYDLRAGYRQGVYDQVISFDVYTQASSSTTASALAANTVTVANTSGLAVGQMVVIIQDQGVSQVAGVGEIASILGNDVTLDGIETGAGALTIDGTDDYLYRMSGSSVDFGTMTDSDLGQSIVSWEVTADVDNGFTVYAIDDGNMRDGANDVDDVADGTVTAGSEEYGARASDTTLASSTFDTQDTGFTTDYQEVNTESSLAHESRDFLTLKAAVSAGTATGSYSHTLSLIAAANY